MGWGFRKRITLLPGFKLNISRRGISATIGPRGLNINVGKKGTYLNTGLPGTGIYSRTKLLASATTAHRDAVNKDEDPPFDQSLIERVLLDLVMTITDVIHEGGKNYQFNFTFCCRQCGGSTIKIPDDRADEGPVTCSKCGVLFGTFDAVRRVGNYIGQYELKRRGLSTPSRPTP